MSLTPRLQLPYLAAGQAQKHVTVNEAFLSLDMLCQLGLKSIATLVPPATPAEGDRYAVPTGASGAWATQIGKVAAFLDGGWRFFEPREGWMAWVEDATALHVFRAGSWQAAFTAMQNVDLLGIRTTADATTRFAIASAVTRFDHEGGNHRMVVNKALATDTASLLFQRGYSGRAEIGLTGSDSLDVKVSANGTTWHNAMSLSASAVNIESAASTNLRLRTSGTGTLRFGTAGVDRLALDAAGHVVPLTDNASRLGGPGARFQELWSANGVIQTSDAREKAVETPFASGGAIAMLEAIAPVMFRWGEAGADSRLHAGFLAQDVKAALDGAGLDFGVWGLDDVDNPERRQWLRPDQLIPVLWAALKATRGELRAIKERLPLSTDA
jgi:hypothetical protein